MSRNTLRSDIQLIHQREKKRMYEYLDNISSRVSLTTDIWIARYQGIEYICITAHFVDDDWVLKKKIIYFQDIEYSHNGPTLSKVLRDSILDWNIDKKVFSLVVDNGSASDWIVKDLKLWLCQKPLLPLEGVFFHVRCIAHILNLNVSDGLEIIKETIRRTREMKTEMQIYLEEPLLTLDSNAKCEILDWWKFNVCRYPMLSKIAHDVLAVPVTIVASEAAFSMGERVCHLSLALLMKERFNLVEDAKVVDLAFQVLHRGCETNIIFMHHCDLSLCTSTY
uniref:HAT C-terminal dimerisation domain-containing protein n=1 Tax=Kalanchoe fedtschenkoi TaxID=63787 RepID=A0A7N0VK88_KALFE